jgi:hypothetical protein
VRVAKASEVEEGALQLLVLQTFKFVTPALPSFNDKNCTQPLASTYPYIEAEAPDGQLEPVRPGKPAAIIAVHDSVTETQLTPLTPVGSTAATLNMAGAAASTPANSYLSSSRGGR